MAMDGAMSTSSALSYHNAGDFYPRKFGPKPDVVPSGVTERKVGPLDKPDMVSVDVINIKDSVFFMLVGRDHSACFGTRDQKENDKI
ncbi:hypothetical protein F2P81_020594 [Scophthalmus maximus]|uniref:Uncharacterized protein n=1 Tax=Scophthalmus maximus TaxID=52904 RepID=A0A6A4S0F3_SCOMX|nr:hypothetical protein F2P81_020594 [Scophthalmus maximus]